MTGIELKLERVRLGLRQWRVAAALGVPATVVWQIESGRRPLSDREADRILSVLHRLIGSDHVDDVAGL